MNKYPLSHGDIPPMAGATKINNLRPDGLPDGVHAGAWLGTDGLVYKALDLMPCVNAEYRIDSEEAIYLEYLAEKNVPMFPRNWTIQERNGRTFLVRPKCWVLGQDGPRGPKADLDKSDVLAIEDVITLLNGHGILLNDLISIAVDPDDNMFILDCSAMQYMGGPRYLYADTFRLEQFFTNTGYESLNMLRQKGMHVVNSIAFQHIHDGYMHVYASKSRPMDSVWARIPGVIYVQAEQKEFAKHSVFTWAIAKEPLAPEIIHCYELEYAWSPIPELENWKVT